MLFRRNHKRTKHTNCKCLSCIPWWRILSQIWLARDIVSWSKSVCVSKFVCNSMNIDKQRLCYRSLYACSVWHWGTIVVRTLRKCRCRDCGVDIVQRYYDSILIESNADRLIGEEVIGLWQRLSLMFPTYRCWDCSVNIARRKYDLVRKNILQMGYVA